MGFMQRITCVHQGWELYGSDRAFCESVRVIRRACPDAFIEVVLPQEGPIVGELEGIASRIVYEPLWILRRRELPRLATIGMLRLPVAVLRAARRIRSSDLTYVNTTVVADYQIAARLCPKRTVLHVHEIPEGATRTVLNALIRWSGARIIFNSNATARSYALRPGQPWRVVYNGIAGPEQPNPPRYDGSRPLRLLMLGRISRIKGQEVLVEAVRRLPEAVRRRVELRIVGSAFEDEARERALAEQIADGGFEGRVMLSPFVRDPSPLYRWADVVVVPSQRPESLGRVAIEAMSYGIPPVVSRIGGLTETVEDGRSGWVVEPGDADSLSATLARIVAEPEAWRSYPAAAHARYESVFSEAAAAEGIGAVLREAGLACVTESPSAGARA
ncbi:MAG: glycosyl transferase family 1 [Methylobacterium sp. CG08_land_8_20_14_0_20_71_15]|nr:MAG: glycosyl transferase family 1 [Methylobacterium sp. CG09_land_8_20_14_0_10_71_15]PIU12891.1 MAG: glycosyl transferase family 1 [Methylobacterium sp. CG08_land_8_20_14_0_20_71_15]GBU17514.1 glycosyl transferase family 1 [Methylobacterium sp.]